MCRVGYHRKYFDYRVMIVAQGHHLHVILPSFYKEVIFRRLTWKWCCIGVGGITFEYQRDQRIFEQAPYFTHFDSQCWKTSSEIWDPVLLMDVWEKWTDLTYRFWLWDVVERWVGICIPSTDTYWQLLLWRIDKRSSRRKRPFCFPAPQVFTSLN